jgi:hypothetical protein
LGLREDEMHLMDQRILGIVILCLLGMLVTVKRTASGSVLDKPKGSLMIQLVNIFNLFFLLIVNPAAAPRRAAGSPISEFQCFSLGRSSDRKPCRRM